MFKIPKWEEDVPKSKLAFTRRVPKNKTKIKGTNVPDNSQQNGIKKPSFKHKNQLIMPNLNITNKPQENKIINSRWQENKKVKKKPKKNKNTVKRNMVMLDNNIDLKNYDTDKLDELILDEKKKKLNNYNNENMEEILFKENSEPTKREKKRKRVKQLSVKVDQVVEAEKTEDSSHVTTEVESDHEGSGKYVKVLNTSTEINSKDKFSSKIERKKELLKNIIEKGSHRSSINVSKSSKLRQKMMERLRSAKFRYLNEKLYTSSGSDAQQLFKTDPEAFQTYHEGYQQQVKKWPVKPLDVIVKRIQKMPKSSKIADMGCGEAELSRRVPNPVRSFDLVSTAAGVEACDMAHTPLLSSSMDVAVYCLALMGTDLTQYLVEANRVLKIGGHLLIAEVESRFVNVEAFTKEVQKLGFTLKKLDKSHQVFFFMEFTKIREPPVKKAKLPTLTLKPCIYKKR